MKLGTNLNTQAEGIAEINSGTWILHDAQQPLKNCFGMAFHHEESCSQYVGSVKQHSKMPRRGAKLNKQRPLASGYLCSLSSYEANCTIACCVDKLKPECFFFPANPKQLSVSES